MMLVILWACAGPPEPAAPQAALDFAAAVIAEADTDGDGALSREEYAAVSMPDDPLKSYDLDDNRQLSVEELATMLLEADPARQQEARRRGGRNKAKGKGKRGQKAGRPQR